MIKRNKRVKLEEQMIDDIWLYWSRISERNMSKTAAMAQVADIVGCSIATVQRVVSACEAATAGYVLEYDRVRYPNHMMVEYINRKFAQAESNDSEKKEDVSDIKFLAESIKQLAAAISEQNDLIKALVLKK